MRNAHHGPCHSICASLISLNELGRCRPIVSISCFRRDRSRRWGADDDPGCADQPHSLALFMVRGFSSRRHDRRDYQPPPLVSEFSPRVLCSIVDRHRFVHGLLLRPLLRVVDLPARKAVLLRLTPRTLFLMPTLAIVTGTTGWYLAEDMGFTALSWPQYAWVAAALVLVVLMTIQGIGYLLPTNVRVCLE